MSIDPSAAPRVTAGVDRAKDDHVACVAGGKGEVLERFTVRHGADGLRQLAARLLRAGAPQAGIERGDGPVVDTLLAAAWLKSVGYSGKADPAVLHARLLAEIGDARGCFPTRDSLTCLAGVTPSTRQSGKVKSVTFRWGADKQLRDVAQDSRRASPWAASLYDKAVARGCDHPHAVRILARAWAHVIWRCWQDHVPYDPAAHNSLQTLLRQQQPTTTQPAQG